MKMLLFVAGLLFIYLAACGDNDHVAAYSLRAVTASDVIIFEGIDSVQIHTDAVSLDNVSMNGDSLNLKVAYSGGCRDHELLLYASKDFAESYPAQASVYLSHNSNDDQCEAWIMRDLCFNLSGLKEEYIKLYNDNGPIDLNLFVPGAADSQKVTIRYFF